MARYAAGVLGGEGWLLSDSLIEKALTGLDGAPGRQAALRTAARAVTTTHETGTRVDDVVYAARQPGVSPAEATKQLHEVETTHAEAIGATQPNCVTMCAAHNPIITRTTEF